MKTLFLLFNHTITDAQEKDARESLAVERIIPLPVFLEKIWNRISPELPEIAGHLAPIRQWIAEQSADGDYIIIQGDFGACFLMVNFAFKTGLIPLYSTTQRKAREELAADGSVRLSHHFSHVIFRKYALSNNG